MGYPASEKLGIIRLAEGSPLPTRRALDRPGIPGTTFYRWYDRYLSGGPGASEDHSPKPSRVRNRIPEPMREKIKDMALRESDLSPREPAVRFTDTKRCFTRVMDKVGESRLKFDIVQGLASLVLIT